MSADLSPRLQVEFATSDIRIHSANLDRLVAEMRRDADWLEERGQYAGATLTRHTAERVADELADLRDAVSTVQGIAESGIADAPTGHDLDKSP